MERSTISPIVVTLFLTLMTACHRGASGTYMAKFPNGVDWLQLVKTPDNHLTGQFVELRLQADGKVDQKNGTFSGAIDGETMILSIGGIFGMQGGTLSGNLSGNKLTLTGPQTPPEVLNRANFDEYQGEVRTLNAKSQRILAAKVQQNFISGIDQAVSRMQNLGAEATTSLSQIPSAEERYKAVTARMNELVNRERRLSGNPNADVARSQLDVAVSQVSLATEQLHSKAQSLKSSLSTTVQALASEVGGFQQGCRVAVPPGDLTPELINERTVACQHLFQADASYRQRIDALVEGLTHLEDVYQQEHEAQETLQQTAARLR